MGLLELFCIIDDFCHQLEPAWRQQQLVGDLHQSQWMRQLCLSEIVTILIAFTAWAIGTSRSFTAQEHLADRAYAPSQYNKLLGQFTVQADRLLPSADKPSLQLNVWPRLFAA